MRKVKFGGDVMPVTRKLQKIGESFFVSVPKAWVKRFQLEKGNIVKLVEQPDGSIALYPKVEGSTVEQTTLIVDVNEALGSIRRRINEAYIDGFDVIRLKAKDKFTEDQQNIIREIIKDLFGLKIIEVTPKQITIQYVYELYAQK